MKKHPLTNKMHQQAGILVMNKKIKKQLSSLFEPPAPNRRDCFLAKFPYPKTTRFDFYLMQLTYIRKRSWLLSILIMLIAVRGGYSIREFFLADSSDFLACISASMPPLVLLSAAELMKSSNYGMSEMEMSTKYNIHHILLARSIYLVVFDLLLIVAFILLTPSIFGDFGIRTILYLLVPYLLNCVITLELAHNIHRVPLFPVCSSVTLFMTAMILILSTSINLYRMDRTIYWFLAFLFLCYRIIKGCQRINNLEGLLWNLN